VKTAATAPPEERGVARDGVRLLVAAPDGLTHARFRDLDRFLSPGDLLVVNTSATIPAAVDASRDGGRPVTVHVSAEFGDGTWLVELRGPASCPGRVTDAREGERLSLPGGVTLTLLRRYPDASGTRLWAASPTPARSLLSFLTGHGRPIRYPYVPRPWPLPAYQSVFATAPGSAEMPSAARPFTAKLVTGLVAAGVVVAPVTLHAGVASLEAGEPPPPERFTVPVTTAQLVNLTRDSGRRVVAVGTSSTRALESAAGPDGPVRAASGWTSLVLGPDHPARVVTGLITGWHDEHASHLALLAAVAGPALVQAAYQEAERAGNLWHEFGDSCLLLPALGAAPGGRPAAGQSPASRQSWQGAGERRAGERRAGERRAGERRAGRPGAGRG
jgi:S-adenosylmethionine:tRNA ribosyltransferase-isomerase